MNGERAMGQGTALQLGFSSPKAAVRYETHTPNGEFNIDKHPGLTALTDKKQGHQNTALASHFLIRATEIRSRRRAPSGPFSFCCYAKQCDLYLE